MSARILVFSFVLSAITTVAGFALRSADVVVYGSTPGGFCAAIAAARKGASVIVLEPTEHVRGRETKFTVDQTRPMPAGEHFQPIGTVVLAADVETTIQIKNMNTTGFVILDAVQLVPLK